MAIKTPKIKDLTDTEKVILKLITEDFLTVKQIQLRRNCSRQAVYKIIKKLKDKGSFGSGLQKVDKIDVVVNQRLVRLHGQEFNIKILWQDQFYEKQFKKSNILFIEGHTIKLYRNSIEIYSGEGISFYGDNSQEALSKSLKYWRKLFIRLENELKCTLVKPRSRNIKQVNAHFARGDSEITENAIENQRRIKVFAEEDGKLAFITDDSFGFKEDETVHPQTSKIDRSAVDKQVNDWRLNNPPTNSELAIHIAQVTQNQLVFAENMKSHISAIKELGSGVKDLTKTFKKIQKENKKLKLGSQKTLKEFN